jgi:hypothetical protein
LTSINISKALDYQIVVAIIMVIAAWKWGDNKNWKYYYPTILFYILGNFIYGYVFYNYPLWEYESPLLRTTFSDLLIACVFFPSTILIYLPHFPKGLKKQIPYIMLWVIIYTLTERISFLLGYFSYHNGWTIWWSVLFNCVMFPLLILHHKKPLCALLIAFISLVLAMIYFNIPFSNMK